MGDKLKRLLAFALLVLPAGMLAQVRVPGPGGESAGHNGFLRQRSLTIPHNVMISGSMGSLTGASATGATGTTCVVTTTNGGASTPAVFLTTLASTNTLLTADVLIPVSVGAGFTSAPTTANLSVGAESTHASACAGTNIAINAVLLAAQTDISLTLCFNMTGCATAANLKTTGNGGSVQNTVSWLGQTVCADCVITSDIGATTPIKYDISAYSATTGAFMAQVKWSSISSSVDNVLYLNYGKASVTTYGGGSQGQAYDSSTCAVYHLGNGTSISLIDSSTNNVTLTNHGLAAAAGNPDGGASNSGTNYANATTGCTMPNPATVSAFLKLTANAANPAYVFTLGAAATDSNIGCGPRSSSVVAGSSCQFQASAFTGNVFFPTNNWSQMAVTITSGSASGTIAAYYNGTLNGSAAYSANAMTTGDLYVMAGVSGPSINTTGTMEEVRVSIVARGATWLATETCAMLAPGSFVVVGAEI